MRKQITLFLAVLFIASALPRAQSLVDAAKKEAERRKALEEQGVQSKTIVRQGTPAPVAAAYPSAKSKTVSSEKSPSAAKYRAALEKLQREIVRAQERLDSARKRVEAEKNAPLRIGRSATLAGNWQKLQAQVDEWESRLKQLQEDRRKTYNEARKAGLLPGELDGRGITP